jgi:hypothetical protein
MYDSIEVRREPKVCSLIPIELKYNYIRRSINARPKLLSLTNKTPEMQEAKGQQSTIQFLRLEEMQGYCTPINNQFSYYFNVIPYPWLFNNSSKYFLILFVIE